MVQTHLKPFPGEHENRKRAWMNWTWGKRLPFLWGKRAKTDATFPKLSATLPFIGQSSFLQGSLKNSSLIENFMGQKPTRKCATRSTKPATRVPFTGELEQKTEQGLASCESSPNLTHRPCGNSRPAKHAINRFFLVIHMVLQRTQPHWWLGSYRRDS